MSKNKQWLIRFKLFQIFNLKGINDEFQVAFAIL